MKKHRHTLTMTLIVSSILLLVALEIFWIRSSYQNQVFDLRKDSNAILRQTVFQLRDSLLFGEMKLAADSTMALVKPGSITIGPQKVIDTLKIRERSASIQVFLSDLGRNDSVIKFIRPFTQRLKQMDGSGGFSVRIVADSINLDTLKAYYTQGLQEVGISLIPMVKEHYFQPWRVRWSASRQPPVFPLPEHIGEQPPARSYVPLFSDTLFTDPVRLNPSKTYEAQLIGVRGEVFRKITPQILFSIFLTAVTILAFVAVVRTLREQQKLATLKDDFIRNMTHELKTPVATVSVALESLKNFNALNDPQRTQEYLAIAQGELTRLSLLTDKILKSTAFERSLISVPAEPVDLEATVTDTTASLRLVAEKNNVRFEIKKSGHDFVASGAADHLTTVIYNLLDNAVKYSPDGGLVTISLMGRPSAIELNITDHGIGIPQEYQSKIFDQFFRVPTGDVHTIKGYGLGLHYVKQVVEQHGGTISVQSQPGQGSTFTLNLPRFCA